MQDDEERQIAYEVSGNISSGLKVWCKGFTSDEQTLAASALTPYLDPHTIQFNSNSLEYPVDLTLLRLRGDVISALDDFPEGFFQANPVIAVVDGVDEDTVNACLNAGCCRVFSMDGLPKGLHHCMVQIRNLMNGEDHTLREASHYYRLPRPLNALSLKLHQEIGTNSILEALLNTDAAIVMVVDPTGRIIFFNHRAEIVTGFQHDEVVGRFYQDLFLLPEERNKVSGYLQTAEEIANSPRHENSWLTRDGSQRQILWTNTLLNNAHGQPEFVVSFGVDITEEHESRRAQQESQELFEQVFRYNSLGMAMLNFPDGAVLDVNDQLKTLLENSNQDLTGRYFSELGLLNKDDYSWAEIVNRLRGNAKLRFEKKSLTRSRKLLHLLISFDLIEFAHQPCILVTVQDLSERIQFEERMRRFNEELERSVLDRTAALQAVNRELQAEIGFRKAIESSSQRLIQIIWETPDIVAMFDLNGRMQYLNKTGRKIFGFEEIDSVAHLSMQSAYSDAGSRLFREEIRPAIDEFGVWNGEMDLALPDGRMIPVSQVVIGHRDLEGRLQYYSSIARDISDLRKAAEELRVAYEKEKEVGKLRTTFLSMTSHQFRTPLSTILTSAELLEHYGDQWPVEKKMAHILRIQEAATNLNHLLNDIMQYAKWEASTPQLVLELVDVELLCLRWIRELAPTDYAEPRIGLVVKGGRCNLHTDRIALARIIENLLSNALKYTPRGKSIRVIIEKIGDTVELVVEDEGVGIPEQELPLLFNPFHRGSNVIDTPGSGLGLPIVKKNVELIKGSIRIFSRQDEGTRVVLTIPDIL